MDPIVGGAIGGLLRLAPEVLKFFDRKHERKHELALGEQQQELIKLQSHTRLEEISAQSVADQARQGLEALSAAIQAQGKPSGIRWVDAASVLVRPYWTYLVLNTWFAVKVCDVAFAISRDLPWEALRPILWGADDTAMLSALATFWFLDRVIVKQQR